MRSLFLVGRALFGGFFIYNGINHLKHSGAMEGYAAAKGVRAPAVAVNGTAALLLAGGASVVAGLKPRQGLATLVTFLIPTTLQMHRFWEQEDPQQRSGEMVNFSKNVALIGAALALMQVKEPWPASLDELRAPEEDMYVRLGGRDFTALPA
jgi:putative oxidoreductase